MDTPHTDAISTAFATASDGAAPRDASTGSTASPQSHWHNCKTPEPLPQAPPVLWSDPALRVLTVHQGEGFQETDWDMKDTVELQATKAEVRTLAQHHLDMAFTRSLWFSTGWSSSSEFFRQAFHFARYQELETLLDAEDRRLFSDVIRIRNEYIRQRAAEQEARDRWEADQTACEWCGPEVDAREEWEANQDPRD